MEALFTTDFLFSIFRVTTPILFAALGALITSRAGVMNIGLEGMMLASALTGVIVSAFTNSLWLAMIASLAVGMLLAGLMAYFSLKLKTDIILTGIAVNLLSSGGTVFLLYLICQDKGMSSGLKSLVFPTIHIPIIKDIPFIGQVLSGHNLLTYVAFICVGGVYVLLNKTSLGMRIRAVGENSHAAKSVGVNVNRVKCIALLLSGMLTALGGMYMSMGYMSWFSRDMTAGRGFIALAAESLGHSNPIGTMVASLVFGMADAMSNTLQSLRVPAEFIQMMPYVTTILGLILYSMNKTRKDRRK